MQFASLFAALWGTFGVVSLLGYSVYRLSQVAVTFIDYPATIWHWAALIVWIIFMAYTEGYKGFQLAFAPRAAARLHWLSQNPKPMLTLLAPLFAMGLIYANHKRLFISYLIIIMVVCFVAIAETLLAPWRAIVDAGVVVGLLWGAIATLLSAIKVLILAADRVDPELPNRAL
ncbi:MAG: hypothetical protein GY881_07240 [Gammaproteobacteria bacterium]|jgi:hypothetical protein|nr:hypothetical protein [Gammaproteobacteria bacterium]MCP4880938.1 hypothetical protein [Gammaproteobacteria bacterium]MDP6166741.1 hypothetical protein [Gammaproteobacteria bacterium]